MDLPAPLAPPSAADDISGPPPPLPPPGPDPELAIQSYTSVKVLTFMRPLETELHLLSPSFDYFAFDTAERRRKKARAFPVDTYYTPESLALFSFFRGVGFFVMLAWRRVMIRTGNTIGFFELIEDPEMAQQFRRWILLIYIQTEVWLKRRTDSKTGTTARQTEMMAIDDYFYRVRGLKQVRATVEPCDELRGVPRDSADIPVRAWKAALMNWVRQARMEDTSDWDGTPAFLSLANNTSPPTTPAMESAYQSMLTTLGNMLDLTSTEFEVFLLSAQSGIARLVFAAWLVFIYTILEEAKQSATHLPKYEIDALHSLQVEIATYFRRS
jgi:hypothetical protein